jgi:hypothetical protein
MNGKAAASRIRFAFANSNAKKKLMNFQGVFFAGGSPTIFCAPFPEGAEVEVGIIFDGPRRRLGFVRDGQWLGWAPTKLALHDGHGKDMIFYPMVSRLYH